MNRKQAYTAPYQNVLIVYELAEEFVFISSTPPTLPTKAKVVARPCSMPDSASLSSPYC
jgi:hypothetical protein